MPDMIIFGAGASFGSDIFNVPPATSYLIDELISFHPDSWGQIEPYLLSLFRKDFEQGMKKLSRKNPRSMAPLRRSMAEFFFRFAPGPDSLYRKLARRIQQSGWDGVLATFNYERLLELSLIFEGLQPVAGAPQTTNHIEVCLPHGCCHLFRKSVRDSTSVISSNGRAIRIEGPVRPVFEPNEFRARICNGAFPPVMSYFDRKKRSTSGASFIAAQHSRFEEAVLSCSRIAIIGLKVRPRDRHIWGPLARTSGRLIYCSRETAAKRFKNWAKKWRSGGDKVFDGDFDGHFDDICNELDIGTGISSAARKAGSRAKAKKTARAYAKAWEETEAKAQAEARSRAKAEEKAKFYAEQIAAAKAEASEIIAKSKAEAAETIAGIKSESEKMTREYADSIAQSKSKFRAEAEQRASMYAAAIEEAETRAESEARLRSEAEEKVKGYAAAAEKAVKRLRSEIEERRKAEAKAEAESKYRFEAEEMASSEAESRTKAVKEAKAEAEARTETEEKAETERQAKAEAEKKANLYARVREEAEARVETEARLRAELQKEAKVYAGARDEAEAQAEAKAESEVRTRAETQEKIKSYAEEITKIKAKAIKIVANQRAKSEAEVARTIARVKVEAAEAIARVKAGAEETVVEQKAKAESEARPRAETQEETKSYAGEIAKIKANAIEIIANQRAKSEAEVARTIARLETVAVDRAAKVKAKSEESARLDDKDNAAETISDTFGSTIGEKHAGPTTSKKLPLNSIGTLLATCAKDITQKDIVWGTGDDSVGDALEKMQECDTGYMVIGHDGVLEGIVSKSDLTGALSPYLRRTFAKWHQPLDDATLQIKIKWIMSRPVRTIRSDTSLTVIIENMHQLDGRCLPVVNEQGKVEGLVTVFDIFKALLKSNPEISTAGKTLRVPPLLAKLKATAESQKLASCLDTAHVPC